MKNFRPTAEDTKRIFPISRISKNYLQGRLTPENHHRNVYLRKNLFFKCCKDQLPQQSLRDLRSRYVFTLSKDVAGTGWLKIGRVFLVERTEVEPFDRIARIELNAIEIDRSLRVKNVLCLPQVD